jgi:hypothetical protein
MNENSSQNGLYGRRHRNYYSNICLARDFLLIEFVYIKFNYDEACKIVNSETDFHSFADFHHLRVRDRSLFIVQGGLRRNWGGL